MGSLTDYAELELLDHIFNVAYSSETTVYLALCTADPTDAATGASCNECANANNYSRKAIAFGTATARKITQDAIVQYDQASGAWGTATHWCIIDVVTYGSGNALAHGAFNEGKAIVNNNTPSVASGQVYVEYSAGGVGTVVAHKLLELMFDNQAYAKPDTFVGLTTAVITDASTGSDITEVSGGSYARKEVDINGGTPPTWTIAASNALDNVSVITMATATASWGTTTSCFVASASTAGDILFYDNDNYADQLVGNGDTVTFPTGDYDISMV